MEFLETPYFTDLVLKYLTEEEYASLQEQLILHPDAGVVIPGTGGLRKLRYGLRNIGKRGGIRIIYYWLTEDFKIFFLALYIKGKKDDLSEQEKKILIAIVEELKNG